MTLRNRLLLRLPAPDFERLRPSLEPMALEHRQVLMEPDRPLSHVYFPENAVLSIVGVVEDGSAVETATVGNEGLLGVPVYLGAMQMSGQAFVQVPGNGHRMSSAIFREEVRRGTALSQTVGLYTQALFTLVAQSSACNRKHDVRKRCARWLLMTHDRTGRDTFSLTQDFLSQMLGVRRASVNEVATGLQGEGLIEYKRGEIKVLDRPRLEAAACFCYTVIRNEFVRMLDGRNPGDPYEAMDISQDGISTVGDGAPLRGADSE